MNVLIVEDSPAYQRVHRHFVEENGDSAVVVASAENALRLLATKNYNGVDVILMDVHLPGMDGFEATELIKSHCANAWLPIIFISCSDSDEDYIRARNAGADAFLTKPINAKQLKQCLNRLKAKHQSPSQQQAPPLLRLQHHTA